MKNTTALLCLLLLNSCFSGKLTQVDLVTAIVKESLSQRDRGQKVSEFLTNFKKTKWWSQKKENEVKEKIETFEQNDLTVLKSKLSNFSVDELTVIKKYQENKVVKKMNQSLVNSDLKNVDKVDVKTVDQQKLILLKKLDNSLNVFKLMMEITVNVLKGTMEGSQVAAKGNYLNDVINNVTKSFFKRKEAILYSLFEEFSNEEIEELIEIHQNKTIEKYNVISYDIFMRSLVRFVTYVNTLYRDEN